MGLKQELYIELFQDFVITYQNQTIHLNDYLSKQTLNLLEILILHHGKSVSKECLMDILWDNNNNPDSALKFTIFHLRKLLKTVPLLETLDMIKTDKNGYCFHPDILWDSDCHQFEELSHTLAKTTEYQLSDYHKMRELYILYKGKLYSNSTIVWFMQKEEQYRCNFLRYIKPLCEFCLKDSRYEDVKSLLAKAIMLEPGSETIHYYQILAYVKEGNLTMAYEYYQKAVDMLIHEYEIELSQKMKELFQMIINKNDKKRDPKQIMMEYQNKTFMNGAFFCSSVVFDYIFEQRSRDAKRTNANFFLYIFEIDMKNSIILDEQMYKLKIAMTKAMRSGDVFAKLNRSQYIALLFCPTEEIAYTIAQRVCANFRARTKQNAGKIHYYLQQINE